MCIAASSFTFDHGANLRHDIVHIYTCVCVTVGTVFFQLSYSQSAADQRASALFVSLLFIMFTANAFLPELFQARPMYFRETTCGAYTAGPFFVSRLIVQLPFVLIEEFILAIMLYFISNFNTDDHDSSLGLLYFAFVVTRYTAITV